TACARAAWRRPTSPRRWRARSSSSISTAMASGGRTSSRAASSSASPSRAASSSSQPCFSSTSRAPRHARPGGGARHLRPHRRDARRAFRTDRRAGRDLPPPRHALRRRVHGHDQPARRRGDRRSGGVEARRGRRPGVSPRGARRQAAPDDRLLAAAGDAAPGRARRDAAARLGRRHRAARACRVPRRPHPHGHEPRRRNEAARRRPRPADRLGAPVGHRRARLRPGAHHRLSRRLMRRPVMRRPGFPLVVTLLALAFLGLFLLYPLFGIFKASVLDSTGAHVTANNYLRVLGRSFYQRALGNSLAIGDAATIVTTLIGVPLAFCLARIRIPGKSVLLALATLPLVLPSFVGAYALVLLFGRAGIVTQALRAVGIPFDSIYG